MDNVGIVLATYNGEKYIRELLDSIVKSTIGEWKIFAFDDGSTDSTCEIIEEYINQYPSKIVLTHNKERYGSTVSFLKGLKEASKDESCNYFMFCDQDDVWLKDKIAVTLKGMKKLEKRRKLRVRKAKAKPLMVFTDAIVVDENLSFINSTFYGMNRIKAKKTDFSHMLIENKCIGCTCMVNRKAIELIDDDFTDVRYHDWWMALIVSAFGKVKFLQVPTILYRQHENNQVGQTDFSSYVKERKSSSDDIRRRLNDTYAQGAHFYRVYASGLKKGKAQVLREFTSLPNMNFFKKRITVIRRRFLKSGLTRNIGLMFYM